ncbi:MAG: amino acid adenylation domain-containing protein, partial [Polyangiales bacterium]
MRAAQQPEAPAVLFEHEVLAYGELDALANKLARALIARGVQRNDPVALYVPRCLELSVFVLAVLKAGAGYVPLDPNYPQERVEYMLRDSRARIVLTVPGLARSFDGADLDVIELSVGDVRALRDESAPLPRRHEPDDLAYVIYTSGSTGQPKGVAMVHRALDNLIEWQLKDSAAGPTSATLQFAPLSFDVHFQELFATWCSGGRLVLIREQLRFELLNLLALIAREKVERLFLPFIALQSLADIAVAHDKIPSTLREVITAGEQLQITRAIATLFERLPEARLFNHYGPSETHVVTSLWLEGPAKSWPALPPIGYALPEVELLVLDEHGAEVPEGELFVGGVALARGYLHRPELTAERFVTRDGQRLYRTGDLVKQLSPGLFQYLGRLDGQVKIRGHRIELGEIEVALSANPVVREAAVTVHEPRPGDKRLVAYLVLEGKQTPDFRAYLAARLPDAMVPSQFVVLPALPRTPSGKVDKRSLPAPTRARPALDVPYQAPRDEHEQRIAQIWSELLAVDELGAVDDFFALGGNSLLALRAVAALTRAFSVEFPIVQFFEHRTIREQASYLRDPEGGRDVRRKREQRDPRAPIAIIGMAGRFPGADSSEALFANLLAGVDAITRFEPGQLDASIPPQERDDPAYVPARGVLAEADKFDATFFAISNNEALVLDPQQRVLLEVAWHALEHAGYAGEASELNVGVYAGTHNNSYFMQLATQRPEAIARVGSFAAMLASEKDYVATRIAHKLDLHGPALSIHTACSTSLVAIATAVEQLRAGMCELALAGGASITVPQHMPALQQADAAKVIQRKRVLRIDFHRRPEALLRIVEHAALE